MRNLLEGRKIAVDYEETSFTDKARKNLRTINACITRHWTDLMIKDDEYKKLYQKFLPYAYHFELISRLDTPTSSVF